MEKFKACEKEMKTKAFSKEGLIQASKLDPKAQEKLETTQWLQSKVEDLLLQVEQAEAEIESLQGGPKKKKQGSANGRLEDLEHLNERRKWHISRLEIVLRLLENGSLPVDRVISLKDDVSYFVDSNTVCATLCVIMAGCLPGIRMTASTRMREFTMNSTWMISALYPRRRIATRSLTTKAKVSDASLFAQCSS